MPELFLVSPSKFHRLSLIGGLILSLCALLIADGVMTFVSVDLIPYSCKAFVVKVLYFGDIRAPAPLEAGFNGGQNGGSCN